jgi:hypothetical protein
VILLVAAAVVVGAFAWRDMTCVLCRVGGAVQLHVCAFLMLLLSLLAAAVSVWSAVYCVSISDCQ